ncbi:hypothetical protein C8N25_116110 [Algoriphagus antarcticus]|uniref:Uncharacterized protein n=1 Tax=Algoriphagus antarcticus TaxID=238540 RepID=A0A3E0DRL6_9BACT|nr:hypothetical protein C8N25_116110 [Algoriphagus antarcticus]
METKTKKEFDAIKMAREIKDKLNAKFPRCLIRKSLNISSRNVQKPTALSQVFEKYFSKTSELEKPFIMLIKRKKPPKSGGFYYVLGK